MNICELIPIMGFIKNNIWLIAQIVGCVGFLESLILTLFIINRVGTQNLSLRFELFLCSLCLPYGYFFFRFAHHIMEFLLLWWTTPLYPTPNLLLMFLKA